MNGATGWLALRNGEVYAVAAVSVRNGRIAAMDISLNPARLGRVLLTGCEFQP